MAPSVEDLLISKLRYTLVFRLYYNGPMLFPVEDKSDLPSGWKSVESVFFRGLNFELINSFVAAWIEATTLPSNRALRVLERMEGGMCDATEQRQIRFSPSYLIPNSISASPTMGSWSLAELTDLRNAFVIAMDNHLNQHARGQFKSRGWLHVE